MDGSNDGVGKIAAMAYQRVFFPLWMGAGVKTRVPHGARALRDALGGDALEIPVPADVSLEKTDSIKAKPALLEAFKRAAVALEPFERVALLGGDCSSDFALVAHSNRLYDGDLAVVWLDTHADMNTPESSPSGHHHGQVLRALLGDSDAEFGALLPKALEAVQVFLAGVRDFDAAELEYVQTQRIPVFAPQHLRDAPDALARAIRAARFTKVHVHLDLDILDASGFRSTGFPSEGGLSVAEVKDVILALKSRFEIVSFAVTEYAPAQQNDDLETVLDLIATLEQP